jgi:hypothetical protein
MQSLRRDPSWLIAGAAMDWVSVSQMAIAGLRGRCRNRGIDARQKFCHRQGFAASHTFKNSLSLGDLPWEIGWWETRSRIGAAGEARSEIRQYRALSRRFEGASRRTWKAGFKSGSHGASS